MNEQKRMKELAGINEQKPPRFKLKWPKDIEGLTMSFLYLGIQNAANIILYDIESRTGSNANPISLQVMEGWQKVEKQLAKKIKLKGQEALDYFLPIVLKEFNSGAPFLNKLYKKYAIDRYRY